MIDNFPYVQVNFRGDEDLSLPEREQWDTIGMYSKNVTLYDFFVSDFFNVFVVERGFKHVHASFHRSTSNLVRRYVIVTPMKGVDQTEEGDDRGLCDVERKIRRITMGVPPCRCERFPTIFRGT